MKKIPVIIIVIAATIVGAFYFVLHKSGAGSNEPNSRGAAAAGTDGIHQAEGEPTPADISVDIPPEGQRTMGLKTFTATVMPVKKSIRTVGRVEIDERKLMTVNIKVEGWIEKLYADYAGKYIKKGDPLADVYSPELVSVQLEYLNLLEMQKDVGFRSQRNIEFSWGDRYGTVGRLTTFDLAGLVKVAKQKFSLWEIPDDHIKTLETTKEPTKTLTVSSPVSGYVVQKPVFKGTRVSPGDKICDIADLSTVWVLADIYEYELPFVKAGQQARIKLSYYPGKEFISKVDLVYPTLSGQTRTAKARFILSNPHMLLKPQMFANVEMELDLGQALSVPETAILDTGKRQVVYVDSGDGLFTARSVKVGKRGNGMVEILEGLKTGEKVAASAVFLIDSEAKLKGAGQ
jgi:membrane fusion protein, copper/silver efflux system